MLPKKRNYDKKIFRLLYILNKLDAKRGVCTRELAGEFNVTVRTVQRDLELLNMTGFPLTSHEKGRNSFAKDFSLKKVMLSEEQASLLSFMYEIAKSLGKSFEESFRDILRKVLTKEKETPFYVKMPTGSKINGEMPCLEDLECAIDECRKTEMRYILQGKEKCVKVHPLKIIFYDGFWYLLARVDEKGWIRTYRLESIKEVHLLGGHFKVYRNLRTLLDQSITIWIPSKRNKKIILKVEKEAARFFKQKAYFPLQKITKESKDGSLTVETKVGQDMEVIPTVLSWIPRVKIVSPSELKKKVKRMTESYLKSI